MILLAISVEGETEEAFVKRLLGPHLRERCGVVAKPILLRGDVRVERIATDLASAYHTHRYLTSLVDFYQFKGKDGRTVDELEAAVTEAVVQRLPNIWDRSRLFPYVQRHEFEGLLFSDVAAFGPVLDIADATVRKLAAIRAGFDSPEDINDHPETAPSKRIVKLVPRYQKIEHGIELARRISLEKIRTECPRFNAWLTRLENLGKEPA